MMCHNLAMVEINCDYCDSSGVDMCLACLMCLCGAGEPPLQVRWCSTRSVRHQPSSNLPSFLRLPRPFRHRGASPIVLFHRHTTCIVYDCTIIYTINCPFGRSKVVTSAWFWLVLIPQLDVSCTIATTTTTTPTTVTNIIHHAAHSVAPSPYTHAASTAPWRCLRAVFTAEVEQSSRPARPSPSPRANEPADQARRNADCLL
jgi:hypothetical protein